MAKKTISSSKDKETKKEKGIDVSKLISKTVKETLKKEKDIMPKKDEAQEKTKKAASVSSKEDKKEKKSEKSDVKKSVAKEIAKSVKAQAKEVVEKVKKAVSKKTEEKEVKPKTAKKEAAPKAKTAKKEETPKIAKAKAVKIVKEKKAAEPKKRKPVVSAKVSAVKEQTIAPILEEEKIQQAKYEIEPPAVSLKQSFHPEETKEIPETYNETKMVALVRDPEWVFVYWDISSDTREKLNIPKGRHHKDFAIRVFDITGVNDDVNSAHSWYDVGINDYAISWYIKTPEPGRSYIFEIGVYSDEGIFQTIARSNAIKMPPVGISAHHDTSDSEEWMNITEENFMELIRLSGGLQIKEVMRGSENISKLLSERLQKNLSSGALSSGAISSAAPEKNKTKGFWLIADAELIIYGATEPDATVFIQGQPVKLTPQGTFSIRFALPDGAQEIPVEAVNVDGDDTRKITITVKRKTY